MANVAISNMSVTWNNAGTTFTAIKMNATDTASAAGSMLMDLQLGGGSRYRVQKDGVAVWSGSGGELMRLNSTGLGIGTNNPVAKLDVNGAVRTGSDGASVGLYLGSSGIRQTTTGGLYFDANSTGAAGGIFFRDSSSFTTRMQIDSSGNLGLGVTPSAWISAYRAIQIGVGSSINGRTDNTQTTISSNAFRNSAGNWIYLASGENATQYLQNVSGAHAWFTAASGTAGNAITFSQSMFLNTRGDLGIGGVTPPSLNGVSGLVGNYLNVIGGSGLYLSGNAYYEGAWKYYGTGAAAEYELVGAEHRWKIASVSGSAGGTISFTQAMTLDASGRLGLGTTSINTASRAHFVSSGTGTAVGDNVALRLAANGAGYSATLAFSNEATASYGMGLVGSDLVFASGITTERMRITSNGNVVVNTAAIATNATDGFLYVPSCAGTPTGTPTTYTGRVPIVVDTTNNKLYFYSGGAWRDAGP